MSNFYLIFIIALSFIAIIINSALAMPTEYLSKRHELLDRRGINHYKRLYYTGYSPIYNNYSPFAFDNERHGILSGNNILSNN